MKFAVTKENYALTTKIDPCPKLGARRSDVDFLENEYYRLRFDPAYTLDRAQSRRVRQSLDALNA